MAVLHLAPEPFIGALLRRRVKRYVSGDIGMRGVDCRLDVTRLPYRDATFDVVWASHVLEHVREDGAALAEISRVLRRGGIAMLAVPISGDTTIEFAAPDPDDSFHVRSPGMDYFHRYAPFFSEVRITDSWALPPQIQPFVCADRGGRAGEPRASSGPVGIHPDYVPICLR